MNLNIFVFVVIVLLTILVVPLTLRAQDVCVLDTIKTNRIEGYVVQSDSQRIPTAHLEIYRKKNTGKPIKEIITDDFGNFSIPNLDAGLYVVTVRAPRYVRLVFKVEIAKSADKKNRKIVVILGTDYNDTCGGGDVRLAAETE